MTAREWDEYIAAAGTFAAAQERMEEAVAAGVDFAELLAVQAARGDAFAAPEQGTLS